MEIKEIKIGENRFSGVSKNGEFLKPSEIIESWKNGFINHVSKNASEKGLRQPQFGSLCSIRANWTIDNQAISIVMPTGTGKTETMLCAIISEEISRTVIIVPSSLLRMQIYEKSRNWGVLYDSGNIMSSVLKPNVLMLSRSIKDKDLFKNYILNSNIIITTINLVNKMSQSYKDILIENSELLIVDEAHHISSKTWSSFKADFSHKKILQFTATPFRQDGKKIDGDIVYNYPLALAQEKGYFNKIDFEPVEEYKQSKHDIQIANKSVEILERDLKNGFEHILLVRASTRKRAIELYENIYSKNFSKFNPVLIISGIEKIEKNKGLESLNKLESRILICVDMFGEGVDIPNLKIVAIHDKYKSIPITLQFIGRIARTGENLGKATIITNIANNDISEALKDMYEKDSDWNSLLSIKSNEYIDKEVKFQDLMRGFDGTIKEKIDFSQMRPKLSMKAYETKCADWKWENWKKIFDESLCKYTINHQKKILIIVEPRECKVQWTSQRNFNNLQWEFFVIYWNQDKNIAFLNCDDKSKGYNLIKKIFGDDIITIQSENIFKCFYGINRLSLATVGLNSAIDGPIRYKMFAGIDIEKGITEANKANNFKSNIFGNGYDGVGKVSIGCSYKGTIWSRWVESISYWMDWCDKTIDKVLNKDIDVKKLLEGVLIPNIKDKLPENYAYRIDWPFHMEFSNNHNIELFSTKINKNIFDFDLLLEEDQSDKSKLNFYLKGEDEINEKFELKIDEDNYHIKSLSEIKTFIKLGNKEPIKLYEYFEQNPPTIWYVDGSSLEGNCLIELSKKKPEKFPVSNIEKWDWDELGVNIRKESQLKKKTFEKMSNSIQYAVINDMLKDTEYSIVFDDDGSGEIADIVGIKEMDGFIQINLFHCKYSNSDIKGARLGDLYQVCGQAEKSVHWKTKPIELVDRMFYRENSRLEDLKPSRFEKGDLKKLGEIRNKLLKQKSDMIIYIVQPGVDSEKITEQMHSLLVTAQSYCLDTYTIPLYLICS